MHIDAPEALALLTSWKDEQTILKATIFRARQSQTLSAKILEINGDSVLLEADGKTLTIDLSGAEFNGDRRPSPNANHGAYLVCEYRNDDRISFHAPRT